MTGNEIRETFLSFFEQRGHTRVQSSPLLPRNDPTLLFTNAGMNQFKDVFTGIEKRDYVRATSSQKCLRAGGKHNDLDEVGRTARHHTFFEMLGNFSFGDYFKREAIHFAVELLLNVYKLPRNRLWFTVYKDDEEAARLWEDAGASSSRILSFGEKDNFWQMGDTGPCGPCSEVNYYLGDEPDNPEKNRAEFVNGAGDETVEIWNLVFMQFERDETGRLIPLPKPSVDTGAGLERLAAVLQGVKSNYETDLMRPIIDFISNLSGVPYVYESPEGVAMRVIADHGRATAFSIADDIYPGNEGRSYVLRKIMRRAIYQGRKTLSIKKEFFYKVTDFVIEHYHPVQSKALIENVVRREEGRFSSTLNMGLQKLDALFGDARKQDRMPTDLELARLYDTFGTPRDLIRVQMQEHGHSISEDEFDTRFDKAVVELQRLSVKAAPSKAAKTNPVLLEMAERLGTTEFKGYDATRLDEAKIIALVRDDSEVKELRAGEEGEVVLNRTPFYAEAGGQVGDQGKLHSNDLLLSVSNTYAPVPGFNLHHVKVDRGSVKIGDLVTAEVDAELRRATERNHTATHLLHAALREVLGTHVKQAGSLVAPNRLRFDFTHYKSLTREEMDEIERLVYRQIILNTVVKTNTMPIEEAMRIGAMALFGEKYASQVRVLTVSEFSKELCGGTHVRSTSEIGTFKIVTEEAIASGIRRIEALTGTEAMTRFLASENMLDAVAKELKVARNDLPQTVEKLQEELKRVRRENDELRLKLASRSATGSAADEPRKIRGVNVLAREASELDATGLRQLSDVLMSRIKSGVVILGRAEPGKASLIVRTSHDLRDRVPAGAVIRELAPIIGGRGGGRSDMAEGGGAKTSELPVALNTSFEVIEKMLAD